MKQLPVFVSVSLIIHLAFFGTLVGWAAKRPRPQPQVYEVSIVSPMTDMPRMAAAKAYTPAPKAAVKGFGEIAKEQSVKEKGPSFKPVEIEKPSRPGNPGKPALSEEPLSSNVPQASTPLPGLGMGEAVKQQSWITSVIELFRQVWRPPQGVPLTKDLKTTFNIKFSRSGEIISKKLMISSHSLPYDRSVEMALNRIKHVPPLTFTDQPYEEYPITFVPPMGY